MSNAAVILKKGEGRTIKAGGMWVFDNEIDRISGSFENGDTVEVHDFDIILTVILDFVLINPYPMK